MKQKLLYILFFIISILFGTGDALAQTQYYVLTESDKHSVNGTTAGPFELSGPGAKLTFQYYNLTTSGKKLEVYASHQSGSFTKIGEYSSSNADYTDQTPIFFTEPYNGQVQFVGEEGNWLSTKRIRNIKVTRASLLIPTPSSITCEAALGKSISQPISIEYSNTNSAGNIKISHIRSEGDANVSFNVSEIDVSQARFGDVIEAREGTVGLSASFSAAAEGTHTGIIKLEHFSGSSTADYTEEIPYTFKITPKPQPSITFFDQEYYPNHVYSISNLCSSTNTDIPLVTTVSGDNAVVIGDKLFILSPGTFTITAEQDATTTWEKTTQSHTVIVDEGNSTTYFELEGTGRTISIGSYKDPVVISIPGPCYYVTYKAEVTGPSIIDHFSVATSTNGSDWTYIRTDEYLHTDPTPYENSIETTMRQLRFERTGTQMYDLSVIDIRFYMQSYMRTDIEGDLTFAETMITKESLPQDVSIDWSDVVDAASNLTVLLDDDASSAFSTVSFDHNPNKPWAESQGIDARWGTSTLKLKYAPKTEGEHGGYVYIHDNIRFTRIKVSGTAISNALKLQPGTAPDASIAGKTYPYVTLEHTLPATYSTLTLPFDTDITEIAGKNDNNNFVAQLSLVTHNEADGYTLFFKKVGGGTIDANQPYVIKLGAPVTDKQWTDRTVETPSAATHSEGDLKGWTMVGNYNPAFGMENKYGLAEGTLRKGGANSTLKAYRAYFEPPTNGENIRTRVAIMDDDGNATYIGEIRDGRLVPEAIYGTDGIPQTELKNGINIVRTKDGRVRKIWKR